MKFYIEMTLLPGAEIGLYFLWSKVYQQIHLAFVEMKGDSNNIPIGISLPEYEKNKIWKLGNKIRFFANDESDLHTMGLKKRFLRLADYVHLTGIRSVPDNVCLYATFRRVQPQLTQAKQKRLIGRLAVRENISVEEVAMRFQKSGKIDGKGRFLSLPYVRMESLSSGEKFLLFISKKEAGDTPVYEKFSAYGLSNTSTVPEF